MRKIGWPSTSGTRLRVARELISRVHANWNLNRQLKLWALAPLICFFASPARSAVVVEEDFIIKNNGEYIAVKMLSPSPQQLAPRPLLLLNFSTDRNTSLKDPLYGDPARRFLEAGHRVLSFDVPAHGERIDKYGKGIDGFCAAFMDGHDPFKRFVSDGIAVIDACIQRGWTQPGRVVVCGNSRSGYCALRLAAADKRIAAVAALAPVTDWRKLREFSGIAKRPEVADLCLDNYAAELAGRPIYLALGNADRRVGTEAFASFVHALATAEARMSLNVSHLRLLIVNDSPGHTLHDRWSADGAQFLMAAAP